MWLAVSVEVCEQPLMLVMGTFHNCSVCWDIALSIVQYTAVDSTWTDCQSLLSFSCCAFAACLCAWCSFSASISFCRCLHISFLICVICLNVFYEHCESVFIYNLLLFVQSTVHCQLYTSLTSLFLSFSSISASSRTPVDILRRPSHMSSRQRLLHSAKTSERSFCFKLPWYHTSHIK